MWPLDPDDFQSLPIQDEQTISEDSLYFVVLRGGLLAISDQGIPRPITADEFRWLDVAVISKTFLGRWRGIPCYALEVEGSVPDNYVVGDLRSWLGRVESGMFYLAGRAKQIVDWDRDHRYCGRCGEPTVLHEHDRARECDDCGLIAYPRISPSIIVLVCNNDKMLLARNAAWPNGMYSTLAGFVEPGESIEQTVHREVMEEVGIKVKNLRYMGSQSWPFPNSLMLGFHAGYDSGELRFNDGEISDAKWFGADELPNIPERTAISRWLIDAFVDRQQKAHS